MVNVSIKCIFCKELMHWEPNWVVLECSNCPAPFPTSLMSSKYKVYLDNDFKPHEIVVSFDDGLVLNAAWGEFSPQNIVIVYSWKMRDKYSGSAKELFKLKTDIGFNLDCEPEHLHQKVKFWLTYS